MQSKWYKEFWPWFIVVITLVVLVACVLTIVISAGQSERIPMDYKKQGLTIVKQAPGDAAEELSAESAADDYQNH